MELDFPAFIVLIVMIDSDGQEKGSKEQNALDLIKFCIINVVEELAQDIGGGYGMELSDERCIVFLLNMKKIMPRKDWSVS